MGTLAQHRLVAAAGRIATRLGDADASVVVPTLDDGALLDGLGEIADARKTLDLLTAVYAAEVDVRSARELGYTGLSQRTGHRTATDLVQHVTGQTRVNVLRAVRAGRDLTAAMPVTPLRDPNDGDDAGSEDGSTDAPPAPMPVPWFAPLTDALSTGRLSQEQFDVIRRGLGEPPIDRYPELEAGFLNGAWRQAAITLIGEATDRGVEDLAAAARLARDTLDPIGTAVRFEERFRKRSLRMWVDDTGQHHGHIAFDDDAAVWVHTIINATLRPRRGPRFVDPAAPVEVEAHADPSDERSNEQLQYDTMMAILRTGANADPTQAFGDRQPGIRIVTTADSVEHRDQYGATASVGYCEETGQAIPGFVLDTYLCDAGTQTVTVDGLGCPLDVGREKRLFTKKQRVAIAVRDGGCLWCGTEPSRCEAHHTDHWVAHHGRTDTAEGVLLCRNCHMRLHNQHWRIRRRGREYWLHAPPGTDGTPSKPTRQLKPRSLLRFRTPPAA